MKLIKLRNCIYINLNVIRYNNPEKMNGYNRIKFFILLTKKINETFYWDYIWSIFNDIDCNINLVGLLQHFISKEYTFLRVEIEGPLGLYPERCSKREEQERERDQKGESWFIQEMVECGFFTRGLHSFDKVIW